MDEKPPTLSFKFINDAVDEFDRLSVKAYNDRYIQKYDNEKKNITTRSITKMLEGATPEQVAHAYGHIFQDHPNREQIFNLELPEVLHWTCVVDINDKKWTHRELEAQETLQKSFLSFLYSKNKSKRFFVMFVIIDGMDCNITRSMLNRIASGEDPKRIEAEIQQEQHINALVFDRETMTLERYESLGNMVKSKEHRTGYNYNDMDYNIKYLLETIGHKQFKYLTPKEYCPYLGPQRVLDYGYCWLFSLYWLELRIMFPHIPPETLSDIISNRIDMDGNKWKKLLDYFMLFRFPDVTQQFKPQLNLDRARSHLVSGRLFR